ncbi:hypothetical protein FGB62_347g07 [Gracilaria domingensis]|nr:hypothetical protein FGB62_347g07 [Gracilaria domingensis]
MEYLPPPALLRNVCSQPTPALTTLFRRGRNAVHHNLRGGDERKRRRGLANRDGNAVEKARSNDLQLAAAIERRGSRARARYGRHNLGRAVADDAGRHDHTVHQERQPRHGRDGGLVVDDLHGHVAHRHGDHGADGFLGARAGPARHLFHAVDQQHGAGALVRDAEGVLLGDGARKVGDATRRPHGLALRLVLLGVRELVVLEVDNVGGVPLVRLLPLRHRVGERGGARVVVAVGAAGGGGRHLDLREGGGDVAGLIGDGELDVGDADVEAGLELVLGADEGGAHKPLVLGDVAALARGRVVVVRVRERAVHLHLGLAVVVEVGGQVGVARDGVRLVVKLLVRERGRGGHALARGDRVGDGDVGAVGPLHDDGGQHWVLGGALHAGDGERGVRHVDVLKGLDELLVGAGLAEDVQALQHELVLDGDVEQALADGLRGLVDLGEHELHGVRARAGGDVVREAVLAGPAVRRADGEARDGGRAVVQVDAGDVGDGIRLVARQRQPAHVVLEHGHGERGGQLRGHQAGGAQGARSRRGAHGFRGCGGGGRGYRRGT